jgi:hypothetical protein
MLTDNLFLLWFGVLVRLFRSRGKLMLENLALRHQLAVLKRRRPRPRLDWFDKLFWGLCPSVLVRLERGFDRGHAGDGGSMAPGRLRFYWRLISRVRKPTGRRRISQEVRDLILRMVVENPTWDAPRIHGELLMLGFDVSERTYWTSTSPGIRRVYGSSSDCERRFHWGRLRGSSSSIMTPSMGRRSPPRSGR